LAWAAGTAVLIPAWASGSEGWQTAAVALLVAGFVMPALAPPEADGRSTLLPARGSLELAPLLILVPPLLLVMSLYTVYATRELDLEPIPLVATALLAVAAFAARIAAGLSAKESALQLAEARQSELLRRANIDVLTDLPNRAALEQRLAEEFERARRYRQALTVCYIDLDHFKAINDTHGHSKGDEVLREVAAALRLTARSIDFIARTGGEEFVVLAPGTWSVDGITLAERLRSAVAAWTGAAAPRLPTVTLSVGVAGFPEHASSPDELLSRADGALYEAKRAGRNRVAIAAASETAATDSGRID
jgi:diguanylate cyclase (GGDEF)-like protein